MWCFVVGWPGSAFLGGADGCVGFVGDVAVGVAVPAVLAGDVAVGVASPDVAGWRPWPTLLVMSLSE